MASASTLAAWEQRLNTLDPTHIELGLERVAEVKQRLFADLEIPPVVIIAGTNGKGSTVALMQACLQQAGYRVGCYTSPHLISLNERIAVNQQSISDDDFVAALNAVEAVQQSTTLTYFEYLTLAAAWHFARLTVDVALLEVGLGGRLDAVNVFDPVLSVVTHIGIDHVAWLGDNRDQIGYEKAGVFRAATPCIYADADPVGSVVAHAEQIGAQLQQYTGQTGLPATPCLAGLPESIRWGVWAALDCLPMALATTEQQRLEGFACASIAGRFQVLLNTPFCVVDVAHNPDSATLLAQKLKAQSAITRWTAVFAAYADKDIENIVAPLLPLVDSWMCCQLDSLRAMSAQALSERLIALGSNSTTAASPEAAVDLALAAEADQKHGIVIFGSFETAGAVIRHMINPSSKKAQ